ncbi:MAG: radical SAM protein [bacterium]|nr:radical SAM protein [bacterium]
MSTSFKFRSIIIEPIDSCNFHCHFCPIDSLTRPKGSMTLEMAERFFKEVAETKLAETVQLGLMGEPFMHKQLFELIEIGAGYGVKIKLFTNGSYLTDANIERLLDSPISELLISYRAIEDTGFSLHARGDFNRYQEQLKKLLKRALEGNRIGKIYLKVFKESLLGNMAGTADMGQKYQTDKVESFMSEFLDFLPEKLSFQKVQGKLNHSVPIGGNLVVRFETIANWFEANPEDPRFVPGLIGGCDGMDGHFGLLWNGEVTTCCKDYDGRNALGNLADNTLAEILESPKARRFAKQLRRGLLPSPYCQTCRGGVGYLQSFTNQLGSFLYYRFSWLRHWMTPDEDALP